MLQTVRITDKRQITIPAKLYKLLNLQRGRDLIVEKLGNSILLTPAEQMVERLAGIIKPRRKIININKFITKVKKEYFSGKNA